MSGSVNADGRTGVRAGFDDSARWVTARGRRVPVAAVVVVKTAVVGVEGGVLARCYIDLVQAAAPGGGGGGNGGSSGTRGRIGMLR